jgi:hypothetical protein
MGEPTYKVMCILKHRKGYKGTWCYRISSITHRRVIMKNKIVGMCAALLAVAIMCMTMTAAAIDPTATVNTWIAMGWTAAILLFIGAYVVYAFVVKGAAKGSIVKTGGTIAVVAMLIIGAMAALGVSITQPDDGNDGGGDFGVDVVAWDVVGTDGQTYISWTSPNRALWIATNASQSAANFTFSVSRTDSSASWAYTDATIDTSAATWYNAGTGVTMPLFNQTAGVDMATWTNTQGTSQKTTIGVPYGEVRSEHLHCVIGLNPTTINAMTALDTVSFTFTVAGEVFVVDVQAA